MRVFISWSGDRSREVGKVLAKWITKVLPGVQPWISSKDIAAGKVWLDQLREALQTSYGIVVLTPENRSTEWLLFEAGSIAKFHGDAGRDEGRLIPYLVDPLRVRVPDPLTKFQVVNSDRDGTQALIKSLHAASIKILPKKLVQAPAEVEEAFNKHWPGLKRKLELVEYPKVSAQPDQPLIEYVLRGAKESYRKSKSLDVRVNLMLRHKTGLRIAFCDFQEDFTESERNYLWRMGEGKCGAAWKTGEQQYLAEHLSEPSAGRVPMEAKGRVGQLKSVLSTPIRKGGEVIAILNADSKMVAERSKLHFSDVRDQFAKVARVLERVLPDV